MGKERSKMKFRKCPLTKCSSFRATTPAPAFYKTLWTPTEQDLSAKSEADTLSTAIGSEYGHWSDTLRKAFDHDCLSYNRRTDQEYREIKKVCLSVLISGTPRR